MLRSPINCSHHQSEQGPKSPYIVLHGFTRQHQKSNHIPDPFISDDLVRFMANWLNFEETIDITRTHSKVIVRDIYRNGERQRLIMDDWDSRRVDSIFALGTNVISKGQSEVWIFKLIQSDSFESVIALIGIVDAVHTKEQIPEDLEFDFTNHEYQGYGYFTLDGKSYHIEDEPLRKVVNVKGGQYLKMELDLTGKYSFYNKGILTISVYTKYRKYKKTRLAFDNIDTNKNYKLAIIFYGGDGIALMDSNCLSWP